MNQFSFPKKTIAAILMLFFLFQNCGKVQISGLQKQIAVETAPELTFSISSTSKTVTGVSDKVLFVIDMSGSNLGKLKSSGAAGSQSGYYWWEPNDPDSPATDVNADRIKAVQEVIQSCNARTENSSSEKIFKIMGFSTSSFFGQSFENCQSEFYNAETAKQSLTGLIEIQNSNKSVSYSSIASFTMLKTSYYNAIDCAQQLVLYDAYMAQNAHGVSGSKYKVFFVTDGQPDEGDSFSSFRCPENDATCTMACSQDADSLTCKNYYANKYKSQLSLLSNRLQSDYSKTFEFNSLYYGKDSEFDSAKAVLSQLSPQPVLKISNIIDLKNQICDKLKTETKVKYNIENVGVFNLNALSRGEQLLSDSDSDGQPDTSDQDSNSPRLTFDHVVGSTTEVCTQVGLGITNCDNTYLKSVKAFSKDLIGYDSDGDGIIDLVELIKGTHPLIKDDFNRDDDNDGVSNIAEILKGHDPLSAKAQFQTIESEFIANQNTGEVQVRVKKFPLVKTGSYQKSLNWMGIDFNHAADDNIMLITYIATPIGTTSNSKKKLFAAVIKVNASSVIARPVFVEIGEY